MATLRVELVSPEREVWSGQAHMVIAKTIDGEIGVLPNHSPVLGVLAEGGVVRVLDERLRTVMTAAVQGGFLSVAGNEVSILAEAAELGEEVDVEAARDALQRALASVDADAETAAEVQRARARLRAAGVHDAPGAA